MNIKDLMMFYGVTNGVRCTPKQKQFFLEIVCSYLKKNGLEYSFLKENSKMFNVCSLVIGDLNRAKKIVVAPYDTLTKTYIPMNYYPFNPKKNTNLELINTALQVIIIVFIGLVMFTVLRNFKIYNTLFKVLAVILALASSLLVYLIAKGSSNKVNFNRNSASVAVLMYLLQYVKTKEVAYVLSDYTSGSYEGAKLLSKNIRNNQTVIILDSISHGEKMVVAHHGDVSYKTLIKNGYIDREYKDDVVNILRFFNKGIELSSGSIINKQFVVKGSRSKNDYEVDIDRLQNICDALIEYLEEDDEIISSR